MKRFHLVAIWAGLFAVAGRFIGPGYDSDAQPSAFMGAVIGAFIGATGWRGAGMLVGLLAGVNVGAYFAGEIGVFLGIAVGAICGWCLGALVIRAIKSARRPSGPNFRCEV